MTDLKSQNDHVPVLLGHVLHYLAPKKGEAYLDLTAGYGGHAAAVLACTDTPAVLVDRDENAIKALRQRFGKDQRIIHDDFWHASQLLEAEDARFDMILADLGVSSPHLDIASRGFAIALDGPLDMRMDQRQELTAKDIVNTYSEADLRDVLRTYGEEPHAVRIAKAIVHGRPIATTKQLAQVITSVIPHRGKTHPATQTFQALRIAVNDELRLVEQSLPIWLRLLKPGGRLAVISFHSLEDRIVKQFFSEKGGNTYDAELEILTKHPVVADHDELVLNPRARSAKLRVARSKNKKERGSDANSRHR